MTHNETSKPTLLEFDDAPRESPFLISPSSKTPTEKPKTFKMPQSSVLASVMDFLPKLKQSNAVLEQKITEGKQSEVDIENVNEDHHISMDLGLGVVDVEKKPTEEDVAKRTEELLNGDLFREGNKKVVIEDMGDEPMSGSD